MDEMALNPNEEMNMTYTSVLTKDNKPLISLQFTRGKDTCEAIIPDCVVTKNNGFSDEEVHGLELYLRSNKKDIIENAKSISGLLNIFGR